MIYTNNHPSSPLDDHKVQEITNAALIPYLNGGGLARHVREIMDLREVFILLTYACNGGCEFCIERNVRRPGMLSAENFAKALAFAKEHELTTVYLHGGEPTMHPEIVNFAQKAKSEGFTVRMFTNGLNVPVLRSLDGIVDEIIFSYRGEISLHNQDEWKTELTLQLLVTEEEFPTLDSLRTFIREKHEQTGMKIRVHTLNPVNQFSYDRQRVGYLEDLFLSLPDDKVYCANNKVMLNLDGVGVRITRLSFQPGHVKYSMTPDGEMQNHFKRHPEEITHDPALDASLVPANEKLARLRADETPIPLDEVLGFY